MQAGRTLALRKYTFVVHDWLIASVQICIFKILPVKKRRNTCCSSFEIPLYIYFSWKSFSIEFYSRERKKKKSHRFLSFVLPKFRDSNSEKTELFRSPHHLSVESALPRDSSSRIILFSRRSWNILSSPFEEKKEKSSSRARKVTTLAKLLDFSSRIKKKKRKRKKGKFISRGCNERGV